MAITSFFALSVDYVDENGNTQSGPSAVAKLKAMQKEWTGYLDEEKIRSVIEKNVEINNTEEAKSQNVSQNNIAYGWKQGINEIRSLLNCSYATGFRDYDHYIADGLSLDVAGDFYDNRIKLLKDWLEDEAKDQFSAKEKEYLINQYESIATPFYYDYNKGWQQLFEFAPTIIMLTMIIVGFLVAGIFSNESAWKADAIFFSCTYGRNKAIISKIAAGFLIVTAIYAIAFGIFTGAVLLYLGADGANLPIQSSWTAWKCFYNITNIQKYLIIGIGGYIGCLFISLLAMYLSAKTKSAVLAAMVPVILIFIPSFISNIDSPIVNKIIGLLPDQLLQAGNALSYFNLYTIAGKVLGAVPILIVLYIVLSIILVPLLYRAYRHTQVS